MLFLYFLLFLFNQGICIIHINWLKNLKVPFWVCL